MLENVWLDQDRVIAVQPKPTFLPSSKAATPIQGKRRA